ncbi:MAG: TetR family transcriptional regulator C-terminal domain-containing protein, partial [Pseudomonadales bacterium]|nr:TetR family transcriptional regulator C-terminal domain-containing protein [Pseudomonadales bacterium]
QMCIRDSYIERLLSAFYNYLKYATNRPLDVIKQLYQWMVLDFQRKQCKEGCLLGNLAAEIGGSSELCQEALVRAYNQWQQRFVPLLIEGQDAGEVRQDIPAELLAEIFWNAWEGSILRMKVTGSTITIERTLTVLLDSLFRP